MKKRIGLGVTICCLLAGSACFGMTTTNGLQLDITWPWPIELDLSWPSNFTHAVDVYYCDDLRTAQWQYLMAGEPTSGLEALVITDLDSTNRPMGFYAPGDADLDTDDDLLADDRERYIYKTDPTLPDTDGDGMPDGWEVAYGFNPLLYADGGFDLDSDGLSNADEYRYGTRPDIADTDADGMSDGWEVANSLDPMNANGVNGANGDPDRDNLVNSAEFAAHTNPNNFDTDGDGMPDGWELQYGFNPSFYRDGGFDLDGDRLNNANEYLRGSRPDIPDTDGDGLSDYAEVFIYKTDPVVTNTPDAPTGYTLEQTGYEWIDISQTGQAITDFSEMDDGFSQISLGIQFPLFDATYDTAYVCNNGFVSFGEGSTEWENQSLPSDWIPEKALCVFWDDLWMEGNPEAAVYVQTISNQCIISFEGIPFLEDEAARLNFQVILKEDGSVLYQYKDVSSDETATTVGMQWGEGSVEFYENVTNGTALLISNGADGDSDLDGVGDAWERKWFGGLDVVTNGSDFVTGDNLFTCTEAAYLGLNPNVTDTDGDGLSDEYEVEHGLNPVVPQDSDGDGLPDYFETAHGLNLFDPADALLDSDGDGFLNVYECRHGTDLFDSNSVPSPDRYISLAGQHIAPFTNSATAATRFQTVLAAAAPYDIIQVADGTYTGLGNRNLNFMGKPLMLLSENGPTSCILNGENQGRGFNIANSTGSVVRGIQFYQGFSYADGEAGGAVCCENTQVLLENCRFRSNSSLGRGGAIYGSTASVTLKNCVFEDNTAGGSGDAGYFDNSSVEMIDCMVTGTLGNFGFWIDRSTFRVQGGTFSNNFCCSLVVSDSSGSISNCVFSDNQAPRYSGGAYVNNSDVVLSGCVFQNNSVALGFMEPGALSSQGGTLLVRNSVFSENSSDEAAVRLYQGSIRLENCSLFGNQGFAVSRRYAGNIVIRNTILWGNESGSYNSAAGMDVEFSCLPEITGTNNIYTDPRLIAATGALLPNSPCIDRGIDLTAPATDILGTPRWDHPWRSNRVDNSIADIGAFEFTDSDTDSDGLGDLWEIYYFTNITFSSGMEDVDGDGLTDGDEVNLYGTDPLSADSDGDGFTDGSEVAVGMNPLQNMFNNPESADWDKDYDGDGMSNRYEVNYTFLNLSDPSDASGDFDGDGLSNVNECSLGTLPDKTDSDNDGFTDGGEVAAGMNPVQDMFNNPESADWDKDYDGDGLSNRYEIENGLSATADQDTDGDGFSDSQEVEWGYSDPLVDEGFKDVDSDGDGLTGWQEFLLGTNPTNAYSDADSFNDGEEAMWQSDPLDSNSYLVAVSGELQPPVALEGNFIIYVTYSNILRTVSTSTVAYVVDHVPTLLNYEVFAFQDLDGNGVQDVWELCGQTNIAVTGSITNLNIVLVEPDNDKDGLPDWWEKLVCGGDIEPFSDDDFDGLSNAAEHAAGTDPLNPDSDRDGALDGDEVAAGSDPNSNASLPASIGGRVRNDGSQQGAIRVFAALNDADTFSPHSALVSAGGAYQMNGLSTAANYFVKAYVDVNANGSWDTGESLAAYAGNSIHPAFGTFGIDIYIDSGSGMDASTDTDSDGVYDLVETLQGRDIHAGSTNDVSNATQLRIFLPMEQE